MRAALARAAAAAFRRGRADPAGRRLRDPLLPAADPARNARRHGRPLARVPAGVFRAAAPELAHHFLGTPEPVVRRRGVAGAESARRHAPYPFSIRSMSSSLKPRWWPISWISTCRTT